MCINLTPRLGDLRQIILPVHASFIKTRVKIQSFEDLLTGSTVQKIDILLHLCIFRK